MVKINLLVVLEVILVVDDLKINLIVNKEVFTITKKISLWQRRLHAWVPHRACRWSVSHLALLATVREES